MEKSRIWGVGWNKSGRKSAQGAVPDRKTLAGGFSREFLGGKSTTGFKNRDGGTRKRGKRKEKREEEGKDGLGRKSRMLNLTRC